MADTSQKAKPWYENPHVWGATAFWAVVLWFVWEAFFAKPLPGPGKQTFSIDPSLQRFLDQKARESGKR